ncbi:hypothetical protein EDC94DRAFT_581709 [Helicostylum pulchrum]|nr:hypothetical protein EDC94DRAFT_581709 [Helicostylum pulchrum]
MAILELLKYNLQDDGALSETRHNTLGVFYLLHSKLKDLAGLPRFTFYTELYYMALVHSLVKCFYSFGTTRRWNGTLVHCLRALERVLVYVSRDIALLHCLFFFFYMGFGKVPCLTTDFYNTFGCSITLLRYFIWSPSSLQDFTWSLTKYYLTPFSIQYHH